jgi:murein DD-endopeptidase MepM/ murein hydrolase activator NlpD
LATIDKLKGKSRKLGVRTKVGYQNLDIAGKASSAKTASKESWRDFVYGLRNIFFRPMRQVSHFALAIMILIVLSAAIPAPVAKVASTTDVGHVDPFGIYQMTEKKQEIGTEITDIETLAMTTSYISDNMSNEAYEEVNNRQLKAEIAMAGSAVANVPIVTTESSLKIKDKFVSYTIQNGDTLWSIARQFSVTTDSIKWSNGITDENFVKPGATINVPTITGIIHTVKAGETVEGIASKYKSTVDAIDTQNDLFGEPLIAGAQIIVPDGTIDPPPTPKVVAVASASTSTRSGRYGSSGYIARTGTFRFPTNVGPNGYYNGYHYWAIDVPNSIGTPIYAADSGQIVEAKYGWSGGFGNTILIDHGDGFKTRYAHMTTLVLLGGYVSKGQVIGYMGSTGRSTGSHLHFEIIKNGAQQNPMKYF